MITILFKFEGFINLLFWPHLKGSRRTRVKVKSCGFLLARIGSVLITWNLIKNSSHACEPTIVIA